MMKILWMFLLLLPLCTCRLNILRIHRFDGICKGYENAPGYYSDIHYFLKNREYYINMTLHVTKDVAEDVKLQLAAQRCKSRDSLDTCENLPIININNLCEIVKKPNTPWATQMPISCPYKKGEYIVSNGTFNGNKVAFFAISPKWYWKITAKVLEQKTNEVLMCVYIEGQVV